MRSSGILDRTIRCLNEARVETALFEGVEEEPTVATVDRIRGVLAEAKAEFVIGLGGGSAMDAAKAAAGLARETSPTAVFLRDESQARPGLPTIAIATTSGTGAEVTPNAVITDPAGPLKASLRKGRFLPEAAFVDPELTLPCPPRVTAQSGMDALTQAIESFVSIHATPVTDALAFEGFRLLWGSLERAYTKGDDLEARTACSYGSLLAGMALANARLGAVHGIVHPLGARYGIPHGLVCAALVPEVTEMNLASASAKYTRLAQAAGVDLVRGLRDLNERLDIYGDLSRYRIPGKDLAVIAEESLQSGSLKANPRKFGRDEVAEVLLALKSRTGI